MPRSLMQMREANARLRHLPCAIPGCTKNRLGVAQYCHAHAGRLYTYGHPQGIPIPRDIYTDELQEVRELFNANKDHPGLTSVVQWIESWVEAASRQEAPAGNGIFGRIHVKRIHGREGLSALDILTEIAAIWVFATRYPQRLPDDQRLTFALSRNVARLATLEKVRYGKTQSKTTKNPTVAELRGAGLRIRQTLGLFLINVVESLKRRAEKAQDFKTSLSIPFE